MTIHKLSLLLFLILLALTQPVQQQSGSGSEGGSGSGGDKKGQVKEDVVLAIGNIMPGQIDITKTNQVMHYIKVQNLEKKFLFIRINTFDKVRMAIGIYLNQTRQLVYSCQQNYFDSCYISSTNLKPNKTYAILLLVSDSLKYNFYTYWADIEHIIPNKVTKFMFDQSNPTQLFHLQFENNIQKQTQQIRIILKPQASRIQGDNLKIFGNIGFKGEPTVEQHQLKSTRVWGDSQAIIINKQKFVNEQGISLYIVGSAQTVYLLQAQFLKNTTHQLRSAQTVNQYLQPNKSATYKVSLGPLIDTDVYVIKISSFNGEMTPSFFYNAELTDPFVKSSYQYMSDMQFSIVKEDLKKGQTQIYMLIKSYDLQATYQITTQLRQKQIAYQMTENVFEFTTIGPNKTQVMYFYSHLWDSSMYQNLKMLKFDISSIKIQGALDIKYYYCTDQATDQQCKILPPQSLPNNTKLQPLHPLSISQIGSKTITTLQISEQSYKKINNVQKRLMILISLTSTSTTESSSIALEYSNPNQVRLLREGRAFQDKVRDREFKYYKYVNNNPKISEIRVHFNQISGLTKVRARRSNFLDTAKTNDISQQYTIDKNLPDTIKITTNTTTPIYIQVFGIVNSLYTISISAIHAEHLISNSLIMAEDIQYQVKLLAYQHMNVEIHPIEESVVFEWYSEGGMVMVCQVDSKDLCLDDGTANKVVSSSGQIKIDARNKRQVRIRIGNYIDSSQHTPNTPSSQSPKSTPLPLPQSINKVKLTLIYHASTSSHCQQRRINKVYAQNIYSGSCYKFHIPLPAQLQIMAVRSDLGAVSHIFLICDKKVLPTQINDRYIIKTTVIEELCKKDLSNVQLKMLVVEEKMNREVKLEYSVEYKGDIVTLLDGVAYTAKGYSTPETSLRSFFYDVLDQDRDINIILYNKVGYQKFYATIVQKSQKYSTPVSQSTSKFTSKSSSYYTNPYIKITPTQIQSYNCGRSCVLFLSVYSTQKQGSQYQYNLQITQNHILLKQDHIKDDFLAKGSVRFYQYQSKRDKGNIVFKVSDNNRKCARIFMSKNPFPTASNYYTKQNQGTIIYQKSQKGTFYFSIQAIQDCPHTVSISQGLSSLTKIQYGQYYDISLKVGEQKWFYTKHLTNSTFKIISLKEHGEIQIYANFSMLDREFFGKLENKSLNKNDFSFKSSYKNTLVIPNTHKSFCFNCYYIICIQATKITQGSIFLGSQSSKISINDKKIVFDEILDKNVGSFMTFYKVSDGDLLVKVHSGAINFEITYGSQKFTKKYQQSKKVYHQTYNFTKETSSSSYSYSPLQIRITAQKVPALYSFTIQPNSTQSVYQNKVTPGEHTYVYLYNGNSQCVSGVLSQKDEQVYLSSQNGQEGFDKLGIVVYIDGNQTTQYQKQYVGNILAINFNSSQTFFPRVKKYRICLTPSQKNTTLPLYIFQSKALNLIHPHTETLIRNNSTFVLYPFHDIILDLFQCRGSSQLSYSPTLQSLHQKQSHKLDTIGIAGQQHAVKIQESSSLYVEVLAKMATILWMPVIQKEEKGIGYFKYAIGNLEYQGYFGGIRFVIGGVYGKKETKTKVVGITYTVFVSDNKEVLQEAVMCEKFAPETLVMVKIVKNSSGTDSSYTVSLDMNKQQITKKFKQNTTLYWNVVADMQLQPPSSSSPSPSTVEQLQNYRFIYYQQTVPSQLFRQTKLQSFQVSLLIVLVIVVVLGFFLIACVFVRYIVPAIGRLKNRVLVEEKEDPRDKSIPLPASSERAQRNIGGDAQVQAETEEGMK